MKRIITTIMTIFMMAIGMTAPNSNAVKAEELERSMVGHTVAETVTLMKEDQDNPAIKGISCCNGVWLTYSQGRVISYVAAADMMRAITCSIAGAIEVSDE